MGETGWLAVDLQWPMAVLRRTPTCVGSMLESRVAREDGRSSFDGPALSSSSTLCHAAVLICAGMLLAHPRRCVVYRITAMLGFFSVMPTSPLVLSFSLFLSSVALFSLLHQARPRRARVAGVQDAPSVGRSWRSARLRSEHAPQCGSAAVWAGPVAGHVGVLRRALPRLSCDWHCVHGSAFLIVVFFLAF